MLSLGCGEDEDVGVEEVVAEGFAVEDVEGAAELTGACVCAL